MANYHGKFRTNYFRVNDADKLSSIVASMLTDDGNVELFSDRAPYYGFGGDGRLTGVMPDPGTPNPNAEFDCNDEDNYGLMVSRLQDILPEDEAIIIMSSGNEKLCYVSGEACIITKDDCRYIDITDMAKAAAKDMLDDPDWDTDCEY